ncbi:hypothetical protein, partial [Escherichia coli]|uniref:hypothetical protein n=1 Tax=Escherichia coli TaxID=562 RepID=UPI0032E4806F
AEVAAQCGWYSELQEIWPEIAQVRGSSLSSVAEILVVSMGKGGLAKEGAREVFHDILRSGSFVNLDAFEVLSLLAVLSLDSRFEAQLLTLAGG